MAYSEAYYANIAEIGRIFGISRPTVYRYIQGLNKEIGDRYPAFSKLNNLICIEVFADYVKYEELLKNKRMRKGVPEFDLEKARECFHNDEWQEHLHKRVSKSKGVKR